jgi:hypothetical protein
MVVFSHQNAGQNHNLLTANKSFENVTHFKNLVTTITNQNVIRERIKSTSSSVNDCHHSVQSFVFLSRRLKVKICKIIILYFVWYG